MVGTDRETAQARSLPSLESVIARTLEPWLLVETAALKAQVLSLLGKILSPQLPASPMGLYLDFPKFSGALHSAGHVDCVSPDVILRFSGPNHSSNHRPMVYA